MSTYDKYPNRDAFDADVKRLYDLGHTDPHNSVATGRSTSAVPRSRRRQGLASKHGAGSTTRRQWKERGMARR